MMALAATLASTLGVFPHQLAYFNELAGGPQNGHEHLLDSNLDWGQDLLYAIEWQRRHPSFGQTFYLLRCSYDPRHLGLRGIDLRRPNWYETLARKAMTDDVTILLSKHCLLQEARGVSRLNVEVIDSIGMSILILRVNSSHSKGV